MIQLQSSNGLHLFGAPSTIRLPHVRRRLDRRDEFQDAVCEADASNDDAGNPAKPVAVNKERPNKDVD